MFDLVAKVERYPEFLPWCVGSRISKRDRNVIYADLIIGWKVIREKFGSKVTLVEPSAVHFDYFNGPLKYLHGHWNFTPTPDGGRRQRGARGCFMWRRPCRYPIRSPMTTSSAPHGMERCACWRRPETPGSVGW